LKSKKLQKKIPTTQTIIYKAITGPRSIR